MKIKRYTDMDRRKVMDRVRSEMGSDAVILSSKTTEDGFSLVACDLDEQLLDQQVSGGKERSLSLVVEDPAEIASQQAENMSSLQEELNKLRTLIEVELPRVAQGNNLVVPESSESEVSLASHLEEFGFSHSYAKSLQEQVGPGLDVQKAWKKALQIAGRSLRGHQGAGFQLGGHFALVGPAGSGKTATLCKIASQCHKSLGPDSVGIISMDRGRFGAHQQIAQFANFMSLPAVNVFSSKDLEDAVEQFSDKKLVLIDTPPLQEGDDLGHCLNNLKETGKQVEGLYCFAATSSRELLLDHARLAKASGFSAVVTRVDECRSLAPIVEALARTSLPLFYLCDGGGTNGDINVVSATEMMQRAMNLYREARKLARRQATHQEIFA